jgi:hypothetical protein
LISALRQRHSLKLEIRVLPSTIRNGSGRVAIEGCVVGSDANVSLAQSSPVSSLSYTRGGTAEDWSL